MARLNAIVDSLANVPEQFHELYTERDGKFEVTGIDGVKTPGDVDRVQEALRKEREDHSGAKKRLSGFGEATPETVGALLEEVQELRIKVNEGGDLDERATKLAEQRLQTAEARFKREQKKLSDQNTELSTANATLVGERNAARVLREGRKALAHDDVKSDADAAAYGDMLIERLFTVDEDGKVVSREVDGLVGGLTPLEVFVQFKQEGEHRLLFGATQSGGAAGSGAGSRELGDNPFTLNKTTGRPTNLTQCAKLVESNPERAKRLCKAAGAQQFFKHLFPQQ